MGDDCNSNTFVATCSGTALTFCANGKLTTLDCSYYGFPRCTTNNGGRCSP
jgi:hypothetical protein